ncbi:hypothetical protein VaNZ11_013762 [Volvox africanus]|uniref:SAM domain-containing protein n=1 Tax=Volvox africanus TaxID=51714 RepID=A0ABQ5SI83_9CHLO|nr:hypothetical protein VaNZ11_013762 [Volvox africanus]
MEGDSDEFGLGNTGDLEIDHHDTSGLSAQARSQAAESGLFSTDGDDDFGSGNNGPPSGGLSAMPPRPLPPGPGNQRGSSGLFSGTDDDDFGADDPDLPSRRNAPQPPRPPPLPSSNRGGSSGLFSSGDDFDADSGDLPPRPGPELRPRAPPPAPSRRSDSGGLFSDDGLNSGELGLSDLGTEIDHGGAQPSRRLPPPTGDFTNPSLSLDANDSDIADLLGPQSTNAAPGPALPAALPPRPGPVRTVTAPLPPPPPPPASGGYGLGEDDPELAELLGETPRGATTRPALSSGQPSNRRITFQEPIAAPLQSPALAPQQQYQRVQQPQAVGLESGSFDDDSGDGYGLERDAKSGLTELGSRRDTPSDDFASGDDYGSVTFGGRVPAVATSPVPSAGASFKRIPSPGSGYDPVQDPLDSPVARGGRPPPRGIPPRRQIGESSEGNFNLIDEYGDDEDGYGSGMYGNRGDGRSDRRSGGVAFRRIPSPTRGPPPKRPAAPSPPGDDDYEDEFEVEDDEDVFADDASWDGEIRFSRGGGAGRVNHVVNAARPRSARQPRSRGLQVAGDTRMRATSALPPRERQAALITNMMSRHPSTWDIREVASWVEFIGLGQYRPKFVHNCVDGGLLLSLGDAELSRDLRILPLGHRRALLAAIAQLREAAEAMEKNREGAPGAGAGPKSEAARLADLRQRAGEQEVDRRPSSITARLIPPEPFLGPAAGKVTVYEQRAKLLYQLDRARHRAAQHAAIIEQLSNNKALTEAQMAEVRGKLKDLETKHKDEFSPTHRRGMTASVSPGGPGGSRKGAAALAAAEYGPDAAVPWLPVGRGTRSVNPHPERFARDGEDPTVDLTFRPRVGRVEEVPAGAVRDIVAKALDSRTPFWQRMDFEFEKMRKEREAREEARRKRRERMGVVRRGGEGDDEEKVKSPHWNNYWVPNSNKNNSNHKNFKRGSENEELTQYRSFAKDKTRLSRWFKRFVDDDERTEGDVALERLVNRMIRALVKTKEKVDSEVGDTFDKRIRTYFEQHGYKFETHTSNTIMVRARGTRPPVPARPDTTLYDFEEVEQYYPDYLKKKTQGGQDDYGTGADDEENETRMVPKRTKWKRLASIYHMERQKKIRAAIAMVKMSQFVLRHGVRWPPERDRDRGKKDVWVPSSGAGALHQLDGRDRTFNTVGQENISLHAKLKKALSPPQPVTFQMKMKQQEENEAKAEMLFALMGWPHSSGDPDLGPSMEPLLQPDSGGGEGFGLNGDEGGQAGPRRRWQQRLDFFGALDALLDRALELRHQQEEWWVSWNLARERSYGEEDLPLEPPRAEELNWGSDDPLMEMQNRAMERQRQEWLLEWERTRRKRERQATKMRSQGYREDDIEYRLGPQQEASEVEYAIQNHLVHNVELLARLKDADLLRFKEELKGTKKMMAVYRALRSQMFLDDTYARERRKEEALRAMYDSFRPGGNRRHITPEEQEAIYARLKSDEAKRAARRQELLERKRAEEKASLTPWYMLPRSVSRGPSQPSSRATSPSGGPANGRRSTRSPPTAEGTLTTPRRRPGSAARTRGTSGGGGPLEGEGSSRSMYVFGSSTPKSMWDPVGWRRQARGIGASLLDSPGLQGSPSTASISQEQHRTPGAAPWSVGRSAAATPTRQRPSTPMRSSGAVDSQKTPIRSPAPPQRPRSGQAPPASPSRLSFGGAGASARRPTSAGPPSANRISGGGGAGASTGGASAVPSPRPGASAVHPSRSRTQPANTGRGRSAAGAPPASPRRSTARVAFTAPPSPTRSSGGGSLPARGRGAAGAGPTRRGLMDGDTTSSASASPSPERRIATAPRGGAGLGSVAIRVKPPQEPRGLADTDSSPSPQTRLRPLPQAVSHPPPATVMHASGAAIPLAGAGVGGPGQPLSRRSSGASGTAGLGLGQGVPRVSSTGAATAAAATPPKRQPSATSNITSPQHGLSQQSSASSIMGPGRGTAGGSSGGVAAQVSSSGSASGTPTGHASVPGKDTAGPRALATSFAVGGVARASATGSAAAPSSAPGSRRPSTPPQGAIQQESSSTSKTSSTSGRAAGTGIGGAVDRGSGSGQSLAVLKSPQSRSPAAASPPSASPPAASPPSRSPPSHSPPSQSPTAASPRVAPSPQPSHSRLAAVEAEITEGSAGVALEDDYSLDEYEVDAGEGDQLDYGDEGDAGAEDF